MIGTVATLVGRGWTVLCLVALLWLVRNSLRPRREVPADVQRVQELGCAWSQDQIDGGR